MSDRPTLVLRSLRQTCSACPSQWEGETENGDAFYARYRFGHLSWGIGPTVGAAIDASMDSPSMQLGDHYDGFMDEFTMLEAIHARVRRASGRSTAFAPIQPPTTDHRKGPRDE